MWNYKKYILSISLIFLVGCQFKPEVLFENINVGDNLETCLSKGAVVQTRRHQENIFELGNNNIASTYFDKSEVKFDSNNKVKEIELSYHEQKKGKSAQEVYNYMTQYFCQLYKGIKTKKLNEAWELHGFSWEKEGMQNIWETNQIKITLNFYLNKPIYGQDESTGNYNSLGRKVASYWERNTYGGEWVELKITIK